MQRATKSDTSDHCLLTELGYNRRGKILNKESVLCILSLPVYCNAGLYLSLFLKVQCLSNESINLISVITSSITHHSHCAAMDNLLSQWIGAFKKWMTEKYAKDGNFEYSGNSTHLLSQFQKI